jgi:hypothetical protein
VGAVAGLLRPGTVADGVAASLCVPELMSRATMHGEVLMEPHGSQPGHTRLAGIDLGIVLGAGYDGRIGLGVAV